MPPASLEHRRTHNLLLISKLLSQREVASPLTLLLDSIEQSARPLVEHCISQAQRSKTRVVFISFETLDAPSGVDVFLPIWQEDLHQVARSITGAIGNVKDQTLLVFDSLNALASSQSPSFNLPAFFSSLLRPKVSLIATYHLDVPSAQPRTADVYSPSPLQLLKYVATAIITVHCLHHALGRKAAQDRGVAEPSFGLEEGISGLMVGDGAQSTEGVVLEMDFRRKSGRGLKEWFFLRNAVAPPIKQGSATRVKAGHDDMVMLLEDHPKWSTWRDGVDGRDGEAAGEAAGEDITFNLELTERQRQDRAGVVLPYFDAQTGAGQGGRILYDMGVEDDFDEEEDEI